MLTFSGLSSSPRKPVLISHSREESAPQDGSVVLPVLQPLTEPARSAWRPLSCLPVAPEVLPYPLLSSCLDFPSRPAAVRGRDPRESWLPFLGAPRNHLTHGSPRRLLGGGCFLLFGFQLEWSLPCSCLSSQVLLLFGFQSACLLRSEVQAELRKWIMCGCLGLWRWHPPMLVLAGALG